MHNGRTSQHFATLARVIESHTSCSGVLVSKILGGYA